MQEGIYQGVGQCAFGAETMLRVVVPKRIFAALLVRVHHTEPSLQEVEGEDGAHGGAAHVPHALVHGGYVADDRTDWAREATV